MQTRLNNTDKDQDQKYENPLKLPQHPYIHNLAHL